MHNLFSSLPTLPAPGHRLNLAAGAGSSDAAILAALAAQANTGQKLLTVLTDTAATAARLQEELPWFAPALRVRLLPDWETLPYDSFSPHQDLVSERLATLHAIGQGDCDILLVPAATALYRLPPPSFLAAYTFFLERGQQLNADKLRAQLTLAGYTHVTQVVAHGEYSVRGGLIDLFPMGAALPYRLDLFDNEIESIKTFDIDTQRTLAPIDAIRMLPAREFPLDEAGRTRFRSAFREHFEGDPRQSSIYKDVSEGLAPAGIEYWLPLFFESTATLFDYLPQGARLVVHGDIQDAIRRFWQETESRFNLLGGERSRPLLPPANLFLNDEAFFTCAKPLARIDLGRAHDAAPLATALPPLTVERRADDPLKALKQFIDTFPGRVLLLADSPGRRESLNQLLRDHGLQPQAVDGLAEFLHHSSRLGLTLAPLQTGFIVGDPAMTANAATSATTAITASPIALITENELFASGSASRRSRRNQRKKASADHFLRDLTELRIGDPVVHEEHGIGRYQGLVHLDMGLGDTEFLELLYANEAKLLVPVDQLQLISRYSGTDPESAPLHTLGSGQWEKARRKAAEQARDTAAELLALYASRAARTGHAFTLDANDYEAFAEGFGFEETPDQAAAIAAVLADMQRGKPMDRLVCGDVGFGKTEVALRAAFVAAASGQQVAVLCPTTLLCEQHFQTFRDRFNPWPIKIAELSRFKTGKETTEALKGLAEGQVDIIIGTHKLLSKDAQFKQLGLVIIDEEHRFGVRQKEALKALRAEVDVLTLTATPIPRTLAMSLEGIRDFSVIATAPQKRLAIKTFVTKASDGLFREAILRELKRGGQVYVLHNEVDTIENMKERLEKLVPEARIAVGHGQMNERDLERVMRDFTHARANVLLCTTIIETGIDIPNANTILIHRAEKFGLAQLHQLRGRVGRSHHQAYAYLLIQDEKALTRQAKQRLDAIQAMEELGAGFYLAMHDLEIRGAGEVLGEGQSGDITQVGFSLYTDMLNRAVAALKQGHQPDLTQPLHISTEINLRTPALLPSDYCPDVHERLSLYKELAHCDSDEQVAELQEALIDRFGELPAQARCLIESHRLRLLSTQVGISRLDAGIDQISLNFIPNPPIDPMKIIQLIQKNRNYKLAGQDKLILTQHNPGLPERVQAVRKLIQTLQG